MSTVQGMRQMEYKERNASPKINAYIHHQPSQPGKETRANLRGLSLARGQRKKMDSWITER